MAGRKAKKAARRYSATTLKKLFAFSGNQCAHPDCISPIVAQKTDYSEAKVIGHIAHIYAHSVNGPRGRDSLSAAERDGYHNLLLLCPTHHTNVDGQHETYPAGLLQSWKKLHEQKWQAGLAQSIGGVGYAELEVASQALVATTATLTAGSLSIIPLEEKIKTNSLTASAEFLIKIGAAKSAEVGQYLMSAAQIDPGFPHRLREGFVTQYKALAAGGKRGDELFYEMYEWAAGANGLTPRGVAGLCILTHLFIVCDVFEK